MSYTIEQQAGVGYAEGDFYYTPYRPQAHCRTWREVCTVLDSTSPLWRGDLHRYAVRIFDHRTGLVVCRDSLIQWVAANPTKRSLSRMRKNRCRG